MIGPSSSSDLYSSKNNPTTTSCRRRRCRKRPLRHCSFAAAATGVNDIEHDYSTASCVMDSKDASPQTQINYSTSLARFSSVAAPLFPNGELLPPRRKGATNTGTRDSASNGCTCTRVDSGDTQVNASKTCYGRRLQRCSRRQPCVVVTPQSRRRRRRQTWQGRTVILLMVSILVCLVCTTNAQHHSIDSTLTPPSDDDYGYDEGHDHDEGNAATAGPKDKGKYGDEEWEKKKWDEKDKKYFDKMKMLESANDFYKGCILMNAAEEKTAGMDYDMSDHDLVHIHNHRHGNHDNNNGHHGDEVDDHEEHDETKDMDHHSENGHDHDDKHRKTTATEHHNDDNKHDNANTIEHSHAHGMDHHNTTIDHFKEKAGYYKRRQRVCNSEDPPDAVQYGICRKPPIEQYMEIRIFAQPWESALFEAWVLQIILSELLDVPTTIETGIPDTRTGFYDIDARIEYGIGDPIASMVKAQEVGDCRNVGSQNMKLFGDGSKNNETSIVDASDYQPCAHFITELGSGTEVHLDTAFVYDGIFETPKGIGALRQDSWFIPKFTAQRDPSLVSWLGMIGGSGDEDVDDNRHKLAERFKRPTTWKVYCDEISPNHCNQDEGSDANEINNTHIADVDDVAMRPPLSEYEESRYYVPGLYRGHFRATEQNDCTLNPSTCTGHIVDYPCSSMSYVYEQTQYLNIALESNGDSPGNGGYSLTSMDEIWRAANATQSDVIMVWSTPHVLVQAFHGTDAEFIKVNLPIPTEECIEARNDVVDRCDASYRTPATHLQRGSCDTLTRPLQKMSIGNLYDLIHDPDRIPVALQSPAYEVLENFRISEQQLNEIFDKWNELRQSLNQTYHEGMYEGIHHEGFHHVGHDHAVMQHAGTSADPRKAVCDWVGENMDFMNSYVPRLYPRVVHQETNRRRSLMHVASGFAAFVLLCIVLTAIQLYRQRKRRIMQLAQIDFLWLLLGGALMITVAAIMMVTVPNNATCIIVQWILNIGYTLVLVPLIVKVAAVIKLASAAKKMKRLKLTREKLFRAVWCICALVLLFMILWTSIDPPLCTYEWKLKTADRNENGDTIVNFRHICMGQSQGFHYVSVGWHTLLLVAASVLAVQMSKIESQELSESGTLAVLIYSHSVFVMLRMVTYFLSSSMAIKESVLVELRSLIFSLDALSTILIYFMPKFVAQDDDPTNRSGSFVLNGSEPFNTNLSKRMGVGFHLPTPSSISNSHRNGAVQYSSDESYSEDLSPGGEKKLRRRSSSRAPLSSPSSSRYSGGQGMDSKNISSSSNVDEYQRIRIIADLKRAMNDIQQEINLLQNATNSDFESDDDDDNGNDDDICGDGDHEDMDNTDSKNSNTSRTHQSDNESPPMDLPAGNQELDKSTAGSNPSADDVVPKESSSDVKEAAWEV